MPNLERIMSKQVDVYVDDHGQAQHLAVMKEQKHYLSVSETETEYRSLCGSNVTGLVVAQKNPGDVNMNCNDCRSQLNIWKEVNC
jgi:hypothetical protein